MKKTIRKRNKLGPYEKNIKGGMPQEELLEIRRLNREKLDTILSQDDWAIKLAQKYYGDKWLSVIDNHPEKTELLKQKHNLTQKNVKLRKLGTFVAIEIPNTKKPIIQLDMEGNEVKRWESARAWQAYHELSHHAIQPIMNCVSGLQNSSYNSKWIIDEVALKELYKQQEVEFYNNLTQKENEDEMGVYDLGQNY